MHFNSEVINLSTTAILNIDLKLCNLNTPVYNLVFTREYIYFYILIFQISMHIFADSLNTFCLQWKYFKNPK